ncbi:MAG: hypothetical protein AABZ67_00690 [Pseudomonadota bacterium]
MLVKIVASLMLAGFIALMAYQEGHNAGSMESMATMGGICPPAVFMPHITSTPPR